MIFSNFLPLIHQAQMPILMEALENHIILKKLQQQLFQSSKFQNSNEKQINEIISETYDIISKKIKILLENEN